VSVIIRFQRSGSIVSFVDAVIGRVSTVTAARSSGLSRTTSAA